VRCFLALQSLFLGSEKHDILRHDLRFEYLGALGAVPIPGLQIPLDVERFSLLERGSAELRERTPANEVVELRETLLFPARIFPHSIRRQTERADELTIRRGLELRVARDIPEQDDSIHGLHGMQENRSHDRSFSALSPGSSRSRIRLGLEGWKQTEE